MRIVLLGPPGAGKGSLAGVLKEMFHLAHISTGDMLRVEMKKGTQLGLEIKALIEKGSLVSDEIVTRLVEQRVSVDDAELSQGFMLDGFPRTVTQAKDLDVILAKINKPLDFALNMEASIEIILKRLTGRRVCKKCGALFHLLNKVPKLKDICDECGGNLYQRIDDNEETIRKRMMIYAQSTEPIVGFYEASGRIKHVSGEKDTNQVRDDLVKMLNEDKK